MITPTIVDLPTISNSLENSTPQEILQWAVNTYYPKLTMATAFGAEGCVLLAMLSDIKPLIRVFNLETGYQFKETLELRDIIHKKYDIEVEFIKAYETIEEMESRLGGPIYNIRPDECCHIRKIEPLKQTLIGWNAWITAIRRDQTSYRASANIVEWDNKFNLVKINPLANYTKQEIWKFITENDVPYNTLYNQGFSSIGCWPCTNRVTEGIDDRAGRWTGFEKTECGIHNYAEK